MYRIYWRISREFLDNFLIKKVMGCSIKVYIMRQICVNNDKIDTKQKSLLVIIAHLHFSHYFQTFFDITII